MMCASFSLICNKNVTIAMVWRSLGGHYAWVSCLAVQLNCSLIGGVCLSLIHTGNHWSKTMRARSRSNKDRAQSMAFLLATWTLQWSGTQAI